MNSFKRSFLYLTRNKSKSILMILIITLVSTSLITAFTIKKTSEITQKTVKKSFQSVLVTPKANVLPEDSHGEGSLNKTEINKIKSLPYVKGINASQMGVTQVEGLQVIKPKKTHDFIDQDSNADPYLTIFGNTNTTYDARFISGMLKLVQGTHITEESNKKVLVHEEYAKLNNLKIGDKIQFSKDPVHYKGKDFSKVEAEIIGIFTGKTVSQAVYPEEMVENTFLADENLLNEIYGYKDKDVKYFQTNFYLSNEQDSNEFVEELKKTNIDFSYFDILKKDPSLDTYNRSLKILQNSISVLYVGLIVVSTIILVATLMFWINNKSKETGILLALGKKKAKIIATYVLEMLIISVLALSISFAAGNKVGNSFSNVLINKASNEARQEVRKEQQGFQLGADSSTDMVLQTVKNVEVPITADEHIMLFSSILGLIIVSTAVSTIRIIRLKPKEILSELS